MKRSVIRIDEEKCTGCAECIPNCPEGAIQIIDGKARLVSDLFCDGLGACIGTCPVGAISIEEREAEPYDESKVMERIVLGGPNVIKAHLKHLSDHDATAYFNEAVSYLKNHGYTVPEISEGEHGCHGSCPGSAQREFAAKGAPNKESGARKSHLSHWPVQLHLISPIAPYFNNADILVAADCVAFTLADFHRDFLAGNKLVIGFP